MATSPPSPRRVGRPRRDAFAAVSVERLAKADRGLRGDLRRLGIDGFHRWGYPTSWLVYSGTSY